MQNEVENRKQYLIHQLKKLGMQQSKDGRNLNDLSLYSLEWMRIEELNKAPRKVSGCNV